MPFCFLVDLLR